MGTPLDEEPLDRYLNRSVARPVTRLLLPLPISANQVSMLAAVCGVLAGIGLALGPRWAVVAGAFLGWWAMVLDCADGQLARARGGGSRYGYLLDGVADYVIAVSTHVGFILAALASPATSSLPGIAVVALVAACGVVMAAHSNAFESFKARFRASLGEDPGAHLRRQREILEDLERERGIAAWIGRTGFRIYYEGQRKMNRAAKEEGPIRRRAFLIALGLGPTLRLAVLLGSACAAAWWPGAIWIYPAFALVGGNLFFVWARRMSRPAGNSGVRS